MQEPNAKRHGTDQEARPGMIDSKDADITLYHGWGVQRLAPGQLRPG